MELAVSVDSVAVLEDEALDEGVLIEDVPFGYLAPCPLCYAVDLRWVGGVRSNRLPSWPGDVPSEAEEWC